MQAEEGPANERCRGCSVSGYRTDWRVPVFWLKQRGGPPAATEGKSCKDFAAELMSLCSSPHSPLSPTDAVA